VRNEHARARAADASWQHWWQRLIDRGTVVEGILILDADSLHPWVFRGIEGYAAPAPMPEWAQPHLQCDEFEQLVASEQTAAELACVADLNALDDEFERLVGPAALSPATDPAPGIATATRPTPVPFALASSSSSSSSRRLCATDVGFCELLSPYPAPEPPLEGNTDGLQSQLSDDEEEEEEDRVDFMGAFLEAQDRMATAREQTPRSQWTSSDYSELGVMEAFEEELAEQAAEAAEYARAVAELTAEEEAAAEAAAAEAAEAEAEDAYGDAEAEAFLREQVLHMLLRRAGCPQELRVQLTQGGHPWPRLAGTRWWDMMEAAGFFLQDRDPSSTGGAWHDCGDGLRWVDAWGCASVRREEVDGVLGPACVEFWPWRAARGLEPVEEAAEPRARRSRPRGGGGAGAGADPGAA